MLDTMMTVFVRLHYSYKQGWTQVPCILDIIRSVIFGQHPFPFFCISFFLYSFISSFFSIVTFLGWIRLHATWIKPEVVATKKYTRYLHYRFITTGSRFSWSPCCSYMCFFEFPYGPANCLFVYDIVFPMFWTFLWWVNGSVSGPILHML